MGNMSHKMKTIVPVEFDVDNKGSELILYA